MGSEMLYRKKPVVIEAIQWTGDNLAEIKAFMEPQLSALRCTWGEEFELFSLTEGLKIYTFEGPLRASVGDWIIKEIDGEFSLCEPNIFELTYEPVSEAECLTLPSEVKP
jgi:hypothetical protein